MSKPIVPEVSLIFDDSKETLLNGDSKPKSYKEWKQQLNPKILPSQAASVSAKKVVTFDLPIDAQLDKKMTVQPSESSAIPLCQPLNVNSFDPRRNNQPINGVADRQWKQQDVNDIFHRQNDKWTAMSMQNSAETNRRLPQSNQMMNQPMTNESPNQVNSNMTASNEITINDVYQLLHNMQMKNQQQNPMENHQNDLNRLPNNIADNQQRNISGNNHNFGGNTETFEQMSLVPGHVQSNCSPVTTRDNQPTMNDVLSVILRQQEQLMNIQNQVQALLTRPTESIHFALPNRSNRLSDANANAQAIESANKQVGVMTSLEINVQNYKPRATTADENFNTPTGKKVEAINKKLKPCGCTCKCDGQQQMQSSDSGSNDENFDNSPKPDDTRTGWTFYGNILNQVNDVLQSTSPRTNENQSPNTPMNYDTPRTGAKAATTRRHSSGMPNIRTAQFNQVGLQIDDVNISAMSKR